MIVDADRYFVCKVENRLFFISNGAKRVVDLPIASINRSIERLTFFIRRVG